jgi:hypothetical protein
VIVAGLAVLGFGGALAWRAFESPRASAGSPRLALDRTDVDVGYQRFDTPVRVVFTLTNTGDGPLRVLETPPVRVVAGC